MSHGRYIRCVAKWFAAQGGVSQRRSPSSKIRYTEAEGFPRGGDLNASLYRGPLVEGGELTSLSLETHRLDLYLVLFQHASHRPVV